MHLNRKTAVIGATMAGAALTLSAIPAAAGVPEAGSGYAELDQALAGEFTGSEVTLQTQWITAEGDDFASVLAPFQEATGITLRVAEVPSGQHEQLVNVSLNGGVAADLIALAQPAVVKDYGDAGLVQELGNILDLDVLNESHAATLNLYQTESGTWGIPYKVDVKSVVYYPIKAFEAAGYAVPTTWDELIALSDQIVADGSTPWCIGAESGPATGWVLTDWTEDIILRTSGLETYNGLIDRSVPFASPEIQAAWEAAGEIWLNPDYVYGGNTGIVATSFLDAQDPMFNEDLASPECWMHKQATWYGPSQFPDVKAGAAESQFVMGEDVGLFYFPPIDPDLGSPALGAGDGFMVTSDRPEVKAVAQFLALPEGLEEWIKAGSALSPNANTPADWYEGNYKLEIANEIVANASAFGFDASDLMPGSGSFWWNGVSEWVASGGADTEAILAGIDQGWDDAEAAG